MGLGIVGLYLLLAVWVRPTPNAHRASAWRRIHLLAFVVYGAATLHGLGAGSDTRTAWALALYAVERHGRLVARDSRLLAPAGAGSRAPPYSPPLTGLAAVAVGAWTFVGPLRRALGQARPGSVDAAATPVARRTTDAAHAPSPSCTCRSRPLRRAGERRAGERGGADHCAHRRRAHRRHPRSPRDSSARRPARGRRGADGAEPRADGSHDAALYSGTDHRPARVHARQRSSALQASTCGSGSISGSWPAAEARAAYAARASHPARRELPPRGARRGRGARVRSRGLRRHALLHARKDPTWEASIDHRPDHAHGAGCATRPAVLSASPASYPRPRSCPGTCSIADRNNNRVLLLSPDKRIVWHADGLPEPDDAFFTPGYRGIITNEEFNDTLTVISLRPTRQVWSYGHAAVPGRAARLPRLAGRRLPAGQRDHDRRGHPELPDRAAAPSGSVVRVLGGSCVHDPPRGFASPNGDTPLPDGGLLVTEIGGWIDRLDRAGGLVWSMRSPVSYPSDAQLLPGRPHPRLRLHDAGQGRRAEQAGPRRLVVRLTTGENRLDRPSLAIRLPNGLIAINDDWRHRVIIVDPATRRIIWQYGHTDVASAAAGYLEQAGRDGLPSRDRRISSANWCPSTSRPPLGDRPERRPDSDRDPPGSAVPGRDRQSP